jgi:hypothetical protein
MSETEKTILTGAQPVVTDATAASRTGANTDKRISITAPDSVKDAGRVHVGAGMMRF